MAATKHEYVLAQISALDELADPLKRSSRLKYTCLSVGRKYLALGSNTGSVYVFSRDGLKYLQVVFSDSESSSVVAVSLSPNEVYVAFATSSGQVVVMELNIERRQKAEKISTTLDHSGCLVTALVWDKTSTKLYAADNMGKVTAINIPSSKAKTLFIQPREPIARLDSAVVQMDCTNEKILVSTFTRCYLINTAKRQYSQIGKKLRDGAFGATFYTEPNSQYHVVYCSRPGSRIWEVDNEGNVLNTHQFKQLLAIAPRAVVDFRQESIDFGEAKAASPQSVSFNKMLCIGQYLVTWCHQTLYILDPVLVRVLLWTHAAVDIQDLAIHGSEIYVFGQDQTIRRFHLLQVPRCLSLLAMRQKWTLAGQLLVFFQNSLDLGALCRDFQTEVRRKLLQHIRDSADELLAEAVEGILEKIPENDERRDSASSQSSLVRLSSGIFQVGEKKWDSLSSLASVASGDVRLQTSEEDGGALKQPDLEQVAAERDSVHSFDDDASMQGVDTTDGIVLGINSHVDANGVHPSKNDSDHPVDLGNIVCDISSNRCPPSAGSPRNASTEGEVIPALGVAAAAAAAANEESFRLSAEVGKPFRDAVEDMQELRMLEVDRQGMHGADLQTGHPDTSNACHSLPEEPLHHENAENLERGLEIQSRAQDLLEGHNDDSSSVSSSPPVRGLEDPGSAGVFPNHQPSSKNFSVQNLNNVEGEVAAGNLSVGDEDEEGASRERFEGADALGRSFQELQDRRVWSAPDSQVSKKGLGAPDLSTIPRSASWAEDIPLSLTSGLEEGLVGESILLEERLTRSTEEAPEESWSGLQDSSALGARMPTTLLQRLAAGGIAMDEVKDESSLTAPNDNSLGFPSLSTRATLMAVKDRMMASKLTSKTKSLLQKMRGRSPLSKSASVDSLPVDEGLTRFEHHHHPAVVEDKSGSAEEKTVKSEEMHSVRKPPIDTSELETAVETARKDLSDVYVMTNPSRAKACLRCLASELTASVAKVHIALQKQREGEVVEGGANLDDEKSDDVETVAKVEDATRENETAAALSTDASAPEILDPESVSFQDAPVDNGSVSFQDAPVDNGTVSVEVEYERNPQPVIPDSAVPCREEMVLSGKSLQHVLHVTDPFCLPVEAHGTLTDLATLCFETGCHGNDLCGALSSPHPLCQQPHPCQHSGCPSCSVVPPWADSQTPQTAGSACEDCNAAASSQGACGVCIHDHCLALFLRLNAHCLKPGVVASVLNRQEDLFDCWLGFCQWSQALGEKDGVCALITKRDLNAAMDGLRSGIVLESAAVLGHMMRLFTVSPTRGVELAADMSKEVSPLDVLNMCVHTDAATETYFINYILQRLDQVPSYLRLKTLQQLCGGGRTRLACLRGLLMRGAPPQTSSPTLQGESASPGEHLLHWENEDLIDSIVESSLPEEKIRVAVICEKHRYWRGCMAVWKTMNLWQRLLHFIILLRDADLLSQDCPHGYLPQEEREWQTLLQSMAAAGIGTREEASGTLTWPAVGRLMLDNLGVGQAVALLKSAAIPDGCLPPAFFQTAVLQWRAVQQQGLLLHNALEKVDAYLWAKRSVTMAPQLRLALKQEKRSLRAGQDSSEHRQHSFPVQSLACMRSNFLEDPDCHWGVTAPLNSRCPMCGVLLEETVNHNTPGIQVFPCGHMSHRACCPSDICLQCPASEAL